MGSTINSILKKQYYGAKVLAKIVRLEGFEKVGVCVVDIIKDKRTKRMMLFKEKSKLIPYSTMDIKSPHLMQFGYLHGILAGVKAYSKGNKLILAGLGGGDLNRSLRHYNPKIDILSVEISLQVIDLAKKFFGFSGKVENKSFEEWVQTDKNKYDVLVLDASMPDSMSGEDEGIWGNIKAILSSDGIVIINVVSDKVDILNKLSTQLKYSVYYIWKDKQYQNTIMVMSNNFLPEKTVKVGRRKIKFFDYKNIDLKVKRV